MPFPRTAGSAQRSGVTVIEMITALVLIAIIASVAAFATAQIMTLRRALYHRTLARESVANILEQVDGWSFDETTVAQANQLRLDQRVVAVLPSVKLIVNVQDDNRAASLSQDDESSEAGVPALAVRRVVAEVHWGRHPHRIRAVAWKTAKSKTES